MKTHQLLVVYGLAVVLRGYAADLSTNAPMIDAQVRLDLADGSRLIGTTDLANIPLHSDSIGDLKIPLSRIAGIKFASDHNTAMITLTNGDRLRGSLQLTTIPVRTVFGNVGIPLQFVRDFQQGVANGGHAIQLKAANRNYLEIPASDDFDVTENWTFEFWANITGGSKIIITPMMRTGDDCGSEAGMEFDTKTEGPLARFSAIDADGNDNDAAARMNLIDGKWHHWAGVVHNQQIQFYVDGIRVASTPYKAGATGSRCPLRIGYRATHGGCFVDATFAEIRISRSARYDRDFTPATSFLLDRDTIAYWRFNEGSGKTVHDETGRHPGELRGSPLPTWREGVGTPNR